MHSMTAFAELVRPLESGRLRLMLRSVNHKALDVSLRIPPSLYSMEAGIRGRIRDALRKDGAADKIDALVVRLLDG